MSGALEGFLQLVASQVITRIFTFSLNLLAARSLTPEAYGVAAVQFHLINTSILFLSREGFRRACLRVDFKQDKHATAKVLSAGLLTVPLGGLLSGGLTAVLLRTSSAAKAAADYRQALVMQGLAAFLELCAEPLYILASSRLLFRVRVAVETAATLLKSVLTFWLVERTAMPPALAFSWAQVAYAAVTLAGYVAYFIGELLKGRRRRAGSSPSKRSSGSSSNSSSSGSTRRPRLLLDRQLLRLAGAFTLQAGEKLLLAEGSKMVMAAAQSAHSQGVYGLVTNLGSLVVRTLFQPFEEAAFAAFSKAQGQRQPSRAQLAHQAQLLSVLVRSISLVGLLAAAFGPAYSYLLLLLAYSRRWAATAAPAALGAYALYVALLALNGILEAFVHSVASERQLQHVNAWLVAFTAVHVGLSLAAVQAAGALGLIAADAANMLLRIAYCLRFTAGHFAALRQPDEQQGSSSRSGSGGSSSGREGFSLRQLCPQGRSLAAYATAFAVTSASRLLLLPESSGLVAWLRQRGWLQQLGAAQQLLAALSRLPLMARAAAHVGVGVVCLAGVAATVFSCERGVLQQARQLRKGAKEL